MTETKLKPCPFCGSDSQHYRQSENLSDGHGGISHYLWCEMCGACGPDWVLGDEDGDARDAGEAREAWNHRAPTNRR